MAVLVSDSFNRADGAIGTADVGGAWTQLSGTWVVASNRAGNTAGSTQAFAVIDAGVADDIDLQVTIISPSSGGGICFRATDANNLWFVEADAANKLLYKRVAGTFTSVYTLPSGYGNGDVLKIQIRGNTFTFLKNGAANGSYTDPGGFNATATKHGLRDFGGVTRFDDFSVADAPVTLTFAATGGLDLSGVAAIDHSFAATGVLAIAGAATVEKVLTFTAEGDLDLDGEAVVDEDVPVDDPPTGLSIPVIRRQSYSYSAPTFVDGVSMRPQQTRTVIADEVWAKRLRVVIDGVAVTFLRDVPAQVLDWSHSTPFGLEYVQLGFPQITPFDELGTGDLAMFRDGARVAVERVLPAGGIDPDWRLAGLITSPNIDMTDQDYGLVVTVIGHIHERSRRVQRPIPFLRAGDVADIGDRVPSTLNKDPGRTFTRILHVTTNIETRKKGTLAQSRLDFARELLGIAWKNNGVQWRITDVPGRGRRYVMDYPDKGTVDYSVAAGGEGVTLDLSEENDENFNVVYGEWVSPNGCRHQNLKYPGYRPDSGPAYPLDPAAVFFAGGGTPGFAPFAEWLSAHGYTIYSGDTYDARDEAEVREAQQRMGILVDGIVGPQTWGTAFQTGSGEGNLYGAIYLPLAWDPRVEPYLYTPDGQLLGDNPDYDPSIPRREVYLNFGENMHRSDVIEAARQTIARADGLSLVGTVTIEGDPEECSKLEMRSGTTVRVRYLYGTGNAGVKFHMTNLRISEPDDAGNRTATMQVDTKWRDQYTVTQIIERNREARTDPARKIRRQQSSHLTDDTKIPFDCDNDAGHIFKHAVYGGLWRVVRFPAGSWGQFVSLTAKTTNDPSEFALMLFSKAITANEIADLVGNPLSKARPYDPEATRLKNAGLIQAWGSFDQPCGYSSEDAATGFKSDDDPLTGRLEWDSGIDWASEDPPALWLAEYASDSCNIEVRFRNAPVQF